VCGTCGCGEAEVQVIDPETGAVTHTHDGVTHTHTPGEAEPHVHDEPAKPDAVFDESPHTHEPVPHTHSHVVPLHGEGTTTLQLELDVLGKNDELAATNRTWLAERGLVAVNLMSSPGAGKTTLLEQTIRDFDEHILVIEGDQETLLDAERIRAAGARTVQVNTGSGCHLDAQMMRTALDALAPEPDSLLMVENVGNLVCPALFDLGEQAKVVVISVTEGDDKPLKYPHMFAAADLVLVNKADLLPYVDFDVDVLTARAQQINAGVEVLTLSARTGQGLDAWYDWLKRLSR
jgi:hydrogenase nickel incorporation protein HypB